MEAIVIFDGVCNFCNATVNFLMKHDRRERLRFASNQSEAGAALLRQFGIDPANVSSVYLVEGETIRSKSSAGLRIASLLGFPWNLAAMFQVVPRMLRDPVYDWIARNRYRWFGKAEQCRLPSPSEKARFL